MIGNWKAELIALKTNQSTIVQWHNVVGNRGIKDEEQNNKIFAAFTI